MTNFSPPKPGNRPKLGPIQGDPVNKRPNLAALTPRQRALRLAVIKEFKAKKVKKFVEKQIEHLNTNRQIVEGIKFQMGGWWVMDFAIAAGGRADTVRFNLQLKK